VREVETWVVSTTVAVDVFEKGGRWYASAPTTPGSQDTFVLVSATDRHTATYTALVEAGWLQPRRHP
jgi:hypothetical protein